MNDIINTIKDLELSLLNPEVRSSREKLNRLISDDFIEFGTSGNKYTKNDILERLPNTLDRIEYKVGDFSVSTPSENIAITNFKTEKIINGKDKVFSKRSSHWRKTNGEWQMYLHEATRIDQIVKINQQEFEKLIDKDKYQVFIVACKAFFPLGFAYHPWFVINNKGVISRIEVAHYRNKIDPNLEYMFLNSKLPFEGIGFFPFIKKPFREVKLLAFIEGGEDSLAQKVLVFIGKSLESYPYKKRYILTGPNSNTYVQWVLNHFPEWNLKLPWSCIGKDYKSKN